MLLLLPALHKEFMNIKCLCCSEVKPEMIKPDIDLRLSVRSELFLILLTVALAQPYTNKNIINTIGSDS